ncbi:MAG: Rieske (2Fe-2S) protein, partial [Pseudonocardia sp.]|nr:Rieske (2Fe-2S) protein [Pseudonocardia sp.]
PLGRIEDIPQREPVQRHAADTAVLVVRDGDSVTVLADRCPHLSAPMSDGELDCAASTITCPWHGSVFSTDDGAVVHGPATAPLPGFESRVVSGVLQARVRTYPGVPAS